MDDSHISFDCVTWQKASITFRNLDTSWGLTVLDIVAYKALWMAENIVIMTYPN